jgi:hypothetical protein
MSNKFGAYFTPAYQTHSKNGSDRGAFSTHDLTFSVKQLSHYLLVFFARDASGGVAKPTASPILRSATVMLFG